MAERKFVPPILRGRPSCRSSPLSKQSTGLFGNSPFSERLRMGYFVACGRRRWALPLDPASLFKEKA